MSLDYHFYVEYSLSGSEFLEQLLLGVQTTADLQFDPDHNIWTISLPQFTAFVSYLSPRTQSIIGESFGIKLPSIGVIFEMNKFFDHQASKVTMLQAVNFLLVRTTGDISLSFELDNAILIRRSGQLIINQAVDIWSTSLLDLITIPYKMDRIQLN
jgi:hypothetical protein